MRLLTSDELTDVLSTSCVVLSNVSECILVSLDSGAVERSLEPNWMGWQAEGEVLRAQFDVGPLVGIERFSDWGE